MLSGTCGTGTRIPARAMETPATVPAKAHANAPARVAVAKKLLFMNVPRTRRHMLRRKSLVRQYSMLQRPVQTFDCLRRATAGTAAMIFLLCGMKKNGRAD